MKNIICKNGNGQKIEFNYDFSPFFLAGCEGIHEVQNSISLDEMTVLDGARVIGTKTPPRPIVITAQMETDYVKNRNLLYQVFGQGTKGTFTYIEDDSIKEIDYICESVSVEDSGVIRNIQISLICPDPFFGDNEETKVVMAGEVAAFEFPHEFTEEGEEFSYRIDRKRVKVYNESGMMDLGLTIHVEVGGNVKNLVFTHLESGEYIAINAEFEKGDFITIFSERGNKNVILKNGEVASVNLNYKLSESSDFFALQTGENTIQYDAEEGEDNMDVALSYETKYPGV